MTWWLKVKSQKIGLPLNPESFCRGERFVYSHNKHWFFLFLFRHFKLQPVIVNTWASGNLFTALTSFSSKMHTSPPFLSKQWSVSPGCFRSHFYAPSEKLAGLPPPSIFTFQRYLFLLQLDASSVSQAAGDWRKFTPDAHGFDQSPYGGDTDKALRPAGPPPHHHQL